MSEQKKTAVISATFTVETLHQDLDFMLRMAGLDLTLSFAPYNQIFQEFLSETSQSASNSSGINIALIRIEDFLRDLPPTGDISKTIAKTTGELSALLTTYAGRAKVQTIVVILSPSPNSSAFVSELEHATSQLITDARALPGIAVLTSTEIDAVSDGKKYDSVSDELAHIPFSEQYFAAIALAISRKAHALLKTSYKVLVLDCDNTIWRGVVGEDGVNGIVISPAFAAVQHFAVQLHAQGTLICLVSKNTEQDVLEVFEARKDMVLALEKIVAHRINWNAKPQNIASLAQMLNLGLDSFAFIDDNPVECEQMRVELPQVLTLQLPQEDKVESFLAHLWAFDKASVTAEDKRRTQMYRENAARQQLEVAAVDIGDFIKSLNVVTEISVPGEGDWPRLAQLTQRTNQFNFTTLRQTETELRARARDGSTVFRVNVKDRFGDYGLVGLVVGHADRDFIVDIFLLSCRVLGRGVEHAILRHLGALAIDQHLDNVEVPYTLTSKNEPARAFIESVAAQFKVAIDERIFYRIPTPEACSIAHRPGHDPEAVIAASKSGDASDRNIGGRAIVAAASDRYLALAERLTTGSAVRLAARSASARNRTLPGAAVLPSTETERRLLNLWQQVTGIEGLGVNDDFFAIGGNSLLAARLFSEITRQFQIKLPLTTILDTPTIKTLSRRIEQPAQPTASLVALKPGSSRNLFLVHDGDGETLLYANLARRLPDDVAVFGIEPKTLPNIPLAYARIEDMAAWYVSLLKEMQPKGPYFLGGMCAGGVIAYEMSRQLKNSGDSVGLLLLLDAATPHAPKRLGRITKHRVSRLTDALRARTDAGPLQAVFSRINVITRKLGNAVQWEARKVFLRWSTRARFGLLQNVLLRGWKWPAIVPSLTFREIYDSAENKYIPQPLAGPNTVLIRATVGENADTPYLDVYSDDSLGWKGLASSLTIADVEGGHSSMLQEPFVASLADTLGPFFSSQPILNRMAPSPVKESA